MALKEGEVYECSNQDCGCEIQVTHSASPSTDKKQQPRCCCGEEMQRGAGQRRTA